MYKTKYGVSLRLNCFKSSPRSPAPQLSAQIFNCAAFGCPLVQWTQPWNPWEGPAGALLRVGDSGRASWLPVVTAYLQRVVLQWVRSHGRWLPGPLVQSVPAGGLRWSLPGVHESMDLVRCIGGQPIAATLLVDS